MPSAWLCLLLHVFRKLTCGEVANDAIIVVEDGRELWAIRTRIDWGQTILQAYSYMQWLTANARRYP